MKNIRMRLAVWDFNRELAIRFEYEDEHGNKFYAKPIDLIFEEEKINDTAEPTIRISNIRNYKEFFRKLLEDIDFTGIHIESIDAKELKATKYHLEDMRTLVFKDKNEKSLG